jgi:hypothetical protein
MVTPKMKWACLILCLSYILVQTFQWWVFSKAPSDNSPVSFFLFDAEPISVLRSWLMLLSMFGLLYIHFVVSYQNFETHRAACTIAFTSFFTFFLLEVVLRSIELFYIQIQLPNDYLQNPQADKEAILSLVSQFRQIQSAMYFPLGISWIVGSLVIGSIFPTKPTFNYLIKIAFWFNGIRLVFRSATVYLGLNLFPDELYGSLYLPMVFIVFGLMAAWFFLSIKRTEHLSL